MGGGSRLAIAQALGARDEQEDAYGCAPAGGHRVGIVAVADGMGGHAGGEIASRLAVDRVLARLREDSGKTPPARLLDAVETANRAIVDRATDQPDLEGMGTTLIAAFRVGRRLYWASVGDSLLWLYRDGELRRLNEDHSMRGILDRQVRDGEIGAAEARTHPYRNSLRSYLGDEEIALVDCPTAALMLKSGDRIVIASDGIETLAPGEIEDILAAAISADKATRAILSLIRAKLRPRQDNVTVAIWNPLERSWIFPIVTAILLLVAALLAVTAAQWIDPPAPDQAGQLPRIAAPAPIPPEAMLVKRPKGIVWRAPAAPAPVTTPAPAPARQEKPVATPTGAANTPRGAPSTLVENRAGDAAAQIDGSTTASDAVAPVQLDQSRDPKANPQTVEPTTDPAPATVSPGPATPRLRR